MLDDEAELAALISRVAQRLRWADSTSIAWVVEPLRAAGIAPGCHRGADLAANRLVRLQWFAGQLLAVVDKKAWPVVNRWLLRVDAFLA